MVDHHRLAHHAALCGRGLDAVAHARDAAARSARLGAHQEAVHALRLALRFSDLLDATTMADLHDRLSYGATSPTRSRSRSTRSRWP